MNTRRFLITLCWAATMAACFLAPVSAADASGVRAKIRVLIVTGGHDFQTNQFYQIFKDNPEISFDKVEHPAAHAALRPDNARKYDVLVCYDMWQPIGEEAKTDFVNWLKAGKGLVALHHCLGSYQAWADYTRIIGGKYHLDKYVVNGVEKPGSTYQHDVDFRVHIADPNHPVTRGLTDFDIHDETYGGCEVRPESHPLLTTDAPTSTKTICWTSAAEAGRVVYLQLGHDRMAYENPNYRKLVAQAIRWTAKRD